MHAVVRETTYPPGGPLQERREFQQFQEAHAAQPGYRGTILVDAGDGRFITLTLWERADDMAAARTAMTPIVARLLDPLMTSPARLIATGEVVVDDLTTG
jgi:heme-degrading monooxygenase HmoA